MKKKYIIDGFNLAFKIPYIAGLMKSGQIETAIHQVILYSQVNIAAHGDDIFIVFDGKHGHFPPPDAQLSSRALRIIFSKKPQTADDVISEFLRKTNDAKSWTVISSDHQIINTAKDMGAQVVKSEQAGTSCSGSSRSRGRISGRSESAISNQKSSIENHEPRNAKYDATDIDMDYWLEQFGEKNSE